MRAKSGEARGTTKTLAEYLKKGAIPKDIGDGFLLSARGNPITKATKHGNRIIMHLSSGKDIELKPLKMLKEEEKLSREGLIAMDKIEGHNSKLECYTCHANLGLLNGYGCHVKLTTPKGSRTPDYLKPPNFMMFMEILGRKISKIFS